MSFIGYIEYDDASEELKALYDQYKNPSGIVANILRIGGFIPKAMKAHVDFYRAVMFGKSDLSRDQREMIATVVSAINRCHY